MIDRYSRAPMRRIWTEDNKFQAYLEVELLAAEAWSELGIVPKEDVALLRQKARFNVERIHEIEEITRHDVVAFTRTVSESLGDEKKWVLPTAICLSKPILFCVKTCTRCWMLLHGVPMSSVSRPL